MRPPVVLDGGRLATRPFGRTGLALSPVMLGAAPLGDMPEAFAYGTSEGDALATIRAALAGPFNGIDTAASYGDGESERRIGLVLRELGGVPAGFLVATKADRDLTTGDFSGPQMRRSVERSMALLGLDHLPLVYLHDPEHAPFEMLTAPGGAVDTLVDLQREGLIGAVGVAGGPIDESIRYLETGVFAAVITHNRFTLLNRTADPLLDLAHDRGIAVCNAAPYGSGILVKGPDAYPRYAYQDASREMVARTRALADACARHGVPLAAAALQFSVRDPRIDVTIVGMTKPERIAETTALATLPIPDALWPELAAIEPDLADPEVNRWG